MNQWKPTLAVWLLSCCVASCGHALPRQSSAPTVTAAFFALTVSDLDGMAAWYQSNLGFRIEIRSNPENGGPRGAILVRDGARLELLQYTSARPRSVWGLPEAEQVHGILKIGFEVSDIETLFATAQERRLNIFFPLVTPPGSGVRTFGLRDPDGNIVQFFGK